MDRKDIELQRLADKMAREILQDLDIDFDAFCALMKLGYKEHEVREMLR
jgi:Holliday junction resolvasome RuvABC DNA-binding subunit